MGDGRGDCLVVTVLFCRGCGGESFEEDFRCGPKLGVLVDLVAGAVSLISRHAKYQSILLIFGRHFFQSFNLEGSHYLWLCSRLWLSVSFVSP